MEEERGRDRERCRADVWTGSLPTPDASSLQLNALDVSRNTPARVDWMVTTRARLGSSQFVAALIDSGASASFISVDTARKCKLTLTTLAEAVDVELADGSITSVSQGAHVAVTVDGVPIQTRLLVIPRLSYPVILGMDWLVDANPLIDWRTGCVRLSRAACQTSTFDPNVVHLQAMLSTDAGTPQNDTRPEVAALVARFPRVFGEYRVPPSRPGFDFDIEFSDGKGKPFCRNPFRLSRDEDAAMRGSLDSQLKSGMVRQSKGSPWGAPILFAKNRKKDGTLRMVIDYRELNAQTVANKAPLPRLDDLKDRVGRAKRFSKLDLRKAFNQLRNTPRAAKASTFITPMGLFEPTVMQFGLKNAGSLFQSYVEAVLRGGVDPPVRDGEAAESFEEFAGRHPDVRENLLDRVLVYIDDLLLATDDSESNLKLLEKVLTRLDRYQLQANEFFEFDVAETEFVGFTMKDGKVHPKESRAQVIEEWPQPVTSTDVRGFLGVIGYYRDFIKNFSERALPLTALTAGKSKRETIEWTEDCQKSFDDLRKCLRSENCLMIPDPDKVFVVATDASEAAGGAVLMQDCGGKLRPVAFYSRKWTPAQSRYHPYYQELHMIVLAYRHWRCYLEGQRSICYTDHRPLVTGKIFERASVHHHNKMIADWIDFMMQFDVELRHHAGKSALGEVADGISRRRDYVEELQQNAEHMVRERLAYVRTFEDCDWARIIRQWSDSDEAQGMDLKDGFRWIGRRIWVPPDDDVKKQLLQLAHACPIAGHRGVHATWVALSRRFFWDGLYEDVRAFVGACDECRRAKRRTTRKNGLLQPLPVANGPWCSIELDHITGFPKVGEYDAILVVCDRFTKRVHLVAACVEDDAKSLARKFRDNVYKLHGAPSEIISDRGSTFVAQFWREVQKLLGITEHFSIPYHPDGHGQVERTNHTVEECLRVWVMESQSDWPEWLALVEFAINNAQSTSTGYSPFELDAGVVPFRGDALDVVKDECSNADAISWAARFTEMRDHAALALENARVRAKARCDKSRIEWVPQIGDMVYVDVEALPNYLRGNKKLRALFVGPFPVEAIESPVSVKLQVPDSSVYPVFHVAHLRKVVKSRLAPEVRPPEAVIGEHGEEEYLVERIGKHLWRGSKLWFRVKWKGYVRETLQRCEVLCEDVREMMEKYVRDCEDERVREYVIACLSQVT